MCRERAIHVKYESIVSFYVVKIELMVLVVAAFGIAALGSPICECDLQGSKGEGPKKPLIYGNAPIGPRLLVRIRCPHAYLHLVPFSGPFSTHHYVLRRSRPRHFNTLSKKVAEPPFAANMPKCTEMAQIEAPDYHSSQPETLPSSFFRPGFMVLFVLWAGPGPLLHLASSSKLRKFPLVHSDSTPCRKRTF